MRTINPIDKDDANIGCTICGEIPVKPDTLGILWCRQHWYRGKLINKAAHRGYPALDCSRDVPRFLIAQGAWYWCLTAAFRPDEYIHKALRTLDDEVA